MSDEAFEASSVQSQFKTLAFSTIIPAQHMNPVDYNQLLKLTFKQWFLGDPFGGSGGLVPPGYVKKFVS